MPITVNALKFPSILDHSVLQELLILNTTALASDSLAELDPLLVRNLLERTIEIEDILTKLSVY